MTDELNFGTSVAPASKAGRVSETNPFTKHFPTKVGPELDDKGEPLVYALTLTFDGTAETNKETVTNLTGKARRAANNLETPMTARISVTENTTGTGKAAKTVTTLAVWTVTKRVRITADQTPDGQPAAE